MIRSSPFIVTSWVIMRLGRKVYVRHVHDSTCPAVDVAPRPDAVFAPGGNFGLDSLDELLPFWRAVLCVACLPVPVSASGDEPDRQAPGREVQHA